MSEQLWGDETDKAVRNFRISGEPVPARVVHWLGWIKAAAAATNAELGLLPRELATQISVAGEEIAAGTHDEQFPVDVFQTGSGTSTNMNVNEVISALTGGRAHPNDHVNLGQSSNDVFPSAVHLAAADAVLRELLPALERLVDALSGRADEFADVVKAGRTHLMDAVPVTLGREFGGYAAQIRAAADDIGAALPAVLRIPLGGTAVGNGLNTHPDFAEGVRRRLDAHLARPDHAMSERDVDRPRVTAPPDGFAAQAARDPLVTLSGTLRTLAVATTKICNDVRWMASGPRTGLAEIHLPELQKGSSIMPGKVNPVVAEAVLQVCAQVIGNDATITVAAMQGNFELNVMVPVIARNLLQSVELSASAARSFADDCIDGIVADVDRCAALADATLASATALNPEIGYDAAGAVVREAAATGRTLREVALEHGVDAATVADVLDPRRIAEGNGATPSSVSRR